MQSSGHVAEGQQAAARARPPAVRAGLQMDTELNGRRMGGVTQEVLPKQAPEAAEGKTGERQH